MVNILDEVAKEYVSLMLSKIEHDPWDIYGYLDKPAGKRETPIDRNVTVYLYTPMPKTKVRSIKEIHENASKLQETLYRQITAEKIEKNHRADFLMTHVRSLQIRTAMLLGEKFNFDSMTKGLYDIIAPEYDYTKFDEMLKELDDVLPGKGLLADRLQDFKNRIRVKPNKLPGTMIAAAEEFHKISIENMNICRESAPKLSFYGFGSHREDLELDGYVYNWDLDKIDWEIVFSLDYPFLVDDIINFGCHELEPGHLTFIGLRTKAAYEKNFPELAVISQYSPSSAFIEGGARMAIDLCLPGEKIVDFERELLFPLAGIDHDLIGCMPAWHNYRRISNYAKLELDRNIWDGVWTRNEGMEFMDKYLLAPPGTADYAIDHLAKDAGHFVAHDYSRDIVTDYVYSKASTMAERWKLYKDLSTAHISMSAIESQTYIL